MKTILITGANRGLGLEFVKQISINDTELIACCRNPEHADELKQLAEERKNITIFKLDVTADEQILALANKLNNKPLDWIINNAGIDGQQGVTVGNIKRENFLNVLNVNCLSALRISDILLPQLRKGNDKLIVAISSRMGSISDNQSGHGYAYRASKAALNCVMRSFALDVMNDNIKVILLHPGWVKTAMGGENAQIDVQTSVSSMLHMIEAYKDNSHAEVLHSYDGQIIGW